MFLIRKLPRERGADIGVRATAEMLADLMVEDLASDGTALRARLPDLLEEMVDAGTLMKLDQEYSLQTRESSEWEAEFRNRLSRLTNDLTGMGVKRAQILNAGSAGRDGSHEAHARGFQRAEEAHSAFRFGAAAHRRTRHPAWVRDGWGADEKSVMADARADGPDSAVIHVFIPKSGADSLKRLIASRSAANDTLDYKGVPSTPEGSEARRGMETRAAESADRLRVLVAGIVVGAKVIQGGGNARSEPTLTERIREPPLHLWPACILSSATPTTTVGARRSSVPVRGPSIRWKFWISMARPKSIRLFQGVVICRFRQEGAGSALALFRFAFGWPRDAIDGALISLFAADTCASRRTACH